MLLRNPLAWMFDIVEPLIWWSAKILLRSKLSLWEAGKCRFYGEEGSLKLVQSAMKEISKMDSEIYQEILDTNITFILASQDFNYGWGDNRRYCISMELLEDGVDGAIFGIISYFSQEKFHCQYGRIKLRFFRSPQCVLDSLDFAITWLRKQGFTEDCLAILETIWCQRKFGRNHNPEELG